MNNLENFTHESELQKCANDFFYFCENYVKIDHCKKGRVLFKLHNFQKYYINLISSHKKLINKKFRQGGFSTLNVIWLCWRLLFADKENSLLLFKSDREAKYSLRIIRTAIENLPEWMKFFKIDFSSCRVDCLKTGSSISFNEAKSSCKGEMHKNIFIEEAAFIKDMESYFMALYPCLLPDGKIVVVSTPNGTGNWFHKAYTDAEKGLNDWMCAHWNYKDHPEFSSPEWEKETRKNLGEQGWQYEVLANFEFKEQDDLFFVNSNKEEIDLIKKLTQYTKNNKSLEYNHCSGYPNKNSVASSSLGTISINKTDSVFSYWWSDSAEEMAEEHIFANNDYSLFNLIDAKKENMNKLEDRVNECQFDGILKLCGFESDSNKKSGETPIANEESCISEQLLKRISEIANLPDYIKLSFCDNYLCINNISTNLAEIDLCYLYKGFSVFFREDKAVTKTAKTVASRLKFLFGKQQRKG